MYSFEQFEEFYKRTGRCLNDAGIRKNPLNQRQLNTRYERYVKSENKKSQKIQQSLEKKKQNAVSEIHSDEDWERVSRNVRQRDITCALLARLSSYELEEFKENSPPFLRKILDPAHVFRKSSYPWMKYDEDNVYLLNRYSHTNLDSFHHPINGEPIDKEEAEYWWRRIVGDSMFENLKERSKKRR